MGPWRSGRLGLGWERARARAALGLGKGGKTENFCRFFSQLRLVQSVADQQRFLKLTLALAECAPPRSKHHFRMSLEQRLNAE